ncbi:MAG: domain protein putative component of TonB system [Polyangiaceae bacterium]|nr:domain protein putative component of TonB system [Polyangiaceae bacterium]
MSDERTDVGGFEHAKGFVAGEVSGSLGLGPLETQYEELFADALADGVITADERVRLEKAADNLGLDRSRLLKLEQAMVVAYQSRHRVQIVEHYEEAAPSLSPLRVEAEGDAGRALLLKRVEVLEARVKELEEELRRAQAAVNVEVDLSDLEDPTSADGYRQLFRIQTARGDADAAFRASEALVALGAANADEKATFERGRAQTLIAPRGSISQAAWHDFLFHPEQELLTGQIFSLIAPAVLVGRVTSLRRDGKLHVPAPAAKQEVAKATVTAVRAVPWAAAILGLACPALYVEKDRDVGFAHLPGVPPSTVIGKRVLSGKTQLEQAFLVGRHLAWYRQESYLKTLFSAVPDLEDLFLAALIIGNPGLPIADDMKRRVTPIAQAIAPLLEAPQVDALRGCFLRFVEEGGRTNLQRWSAATDKTAARAGLVLCGDLGTALRLLEAEEGAQGEIAKDLLWFSASDRYGKLRRQLGVAKAAVS